MQIRHGPGTVHCCFWRRFKPLRLAELEALCPERRSNHGELPGAALSTQESIQGTLLAAFGLSIRKISSLHHPQRLW